jgi:hypothetical protein
VHVQHHQHVHQVNVIPALPQQVSLTLSQQPGNTEQKLTPPSVAEQEKPTPPAVQQSVAQTTGKVGLQQWPICSWDGRAYKYPYWATPEGQAMHNTVEALNAANVTYIIFAGSLIGAWRHGGAVPCDGDMDIIFPVHLNEGLTPCQPIKPYESYMPDIKNLDGPEPGWRLCGKSRDDYVRDTNQWMRARFPSAGISARPFGGQRINFVGGMGVDWVVCMDGYVNRNPDMGIGKYNICRARFGDVEALTHEFAEEVLKVQYGTSVVEPDSKVTKCLKSLPQSSLKWAATNTNMEAAGGPQ